MSYALLSPNPGLTHRTGAPEASGTLGTLHLSGTPRVSDHVPAPVHIGVAKELVHLSYEDAVLCTSRQRLGAHRFAVTAAWPAGTSVPRPGHGTHHDTRVVAQTIRQAALLLAHAEYGAPLAHAVLLRTFDFAIDPAWPGSPDRPTALDIDVTAEETGHRAGRPTGVHLRMTVTSAGRAVGTADTAFDWIPPAVYRRLRGDYARAVDVQPPLPAPVPVAPAALGRTGPHQITLGPTDRPDQWVLRTDFSDTVLYDHPVDHVPGLALIDAAQQAATLVTAPHTFLPADTRTTFDRYVEFDRPCHLTARTTGTRGTLTVEVTGHQDGERVFRTTVTGPFHP
ncbi:ScbA/BarX family gamma-butyrolactone biosynthesis protein [Streptomyces albireticuli]|uniref:ScbA/BarX family gamma-butyrolactone biosynthesis protein n=1 Tax=Streptomyces albireticuli TaxID=1940 RepID=UPI003685C99E